VSYLEESRVVTTCKIEKALNIGNLDGVRRLAKFVCCSSVYPDRIYRACEEQRAEMYVNKLRIKLNDSRAK
jgi:hypothetical protein